MGVLVDRSDGFDRGPDGHIAGDNGQINGAAEVSEHGERGLVGRTNLGSWAGLCEVNCV